MTQDATIENDNDRLLVEAAEWLVCLTSGEATEADAEALAKWRARSADHDAAFRKLAGMHNLTRAMRQTPAPVIDRRAVLAGGSVLGAVIAAFGIVRPPLSLWPSLAELMADHRTGPGERSAFAPVAGVDVEMNSRTSVSLIDGGRGITLIGGETFVSVATPGRAFAVEAGDRRVSTKDAAFNVELLGDGVRVACASGVLECRQGGRLDHVRAGEQLAVDTNGRATRTPVDPAKATAWRRGLLIFEGTPLAEVIEQINRYRPGRIMLTSDELGHRSVSGVFHTDQIENTVAQIQQALGLHLRHLPGGVLLMG